ncbi:hypothetical protein [Myxococcus stipitatus]|nr:hypothetical protein [Myxococcus stipitatus]
MTMTMTMTMVTITTTDMGTIMGMDLAPGRVGWRRSDARTAVG